MNLGLFDTTTRTLDRMVVNARQSAEAGLSTYWLPQLFGPEILTAIAAIGPAVPDIELGTGIVQTYSRDPMVLAQQALTVQQLVDGRLTLGVGLGHKEAIEGLWGQTYDRPIAHLRAFLDTLTPLLDGGAGLLHFEGTPAPPLIIAGLSPKLIEIAATRATGVMTWLLSPESVEAWATKPMVAATSAADRPPPRIVAGTFVSVTDDVDRVRAEWAETFEFHTSLSAYRAILDKQGAEHPIDVAPFGSAEQVTEALHAYVAAGATDIAVSPIGNPDEIARTFELLANLTTS